MAKLIGSFVLGAAVAFAVSGYMVYTQYAEIAREKVATGRAWGYADAQVDVAHKIRERLGDDFEDGEPSEGFYDVKDISVLVVTRNGVKTLRLYPY